jgi:hypothetical protein
VWLLKTVAGKILSGVLTAIIVGGSIALWQMDPTKRDAFLGSVGHGFGVVGKTFGWLLLVGVLPWATYFLSTFAAKFERNAAGVALVGFYTAVDGALLAWLFDWSIAGATGWIFFGGAVLVALLYNVLICDKIAEMYGDGVARA